MDETPRVDSRLLPPDQEQAIIDTLKMTPQRPIADLLEQQLRALRSALTARDVEIDRLRKALIGIAAAAPHSKSECGSNPGYACALGLGERAREAIDHG